MFNKKLIASVMSVCMIGGLATTSIAKAKTVSDVVMDEAVKQSYSQNQYYKYGGPADLSVANEEKIIEMLKNEGKISKDASYEEAYSAYINYMREGAKANEKAPILKMEKNLKAKQSERVQKYKFEQSTPELRPKEVNILTGRFQRL